MGQIAYGAHQELRRLVARAPLPIAMLDQKMRYVATSPSWISEFGRGRDALDGPIHCEVHPDLPPSWIDVHRRALAGEVIRQAQDSWTQADGLTRSLQWTVSPWRDNLGDVGGLVIFADYLT
jgi:PAS domain S-box-containing protein